MADGFERFVEEHYQAAYRFALSLCGHPEDAGDLTQQAFAIAQRKLHQVRDESKQKSWLFTVLRREFLHRGRDHSRQNHYPLELVEGELPPITVDHAAGMDARSLLAVLQGLEEHFRVPLSLFYFEQLSYREIAEIMETPLGTVMSRLARGKQVLRQRLEQTRVQAAGEHKIIPLAGGNLKRTMDEATLKLRLGAFRAGGQDETDPLLAEASRELERNAELADWFAEEQRFDALMVRKLQEVAAPAGLRETILLNARTPPRATTAPDPVTRWRGHARSSLAWAAGLLFAFFLGRLTLPPQPPAASAPAGADRGLALRAIAYTGRMPALDFVCFNAAEVASWVTQKSAEMQMGQLLDHPVPNMRMIGSSAARWEGRPVIMIALQNEGRMGMLYLVRASDFPEAAATGADGIMEKDGWACKTGRRGGNLFVLTTKGTRKDLDFPMPL